MNILENMSTPTRYSKQFDLQCELALKNKDYFNYSGASTDDDYIYDRVFEWTGKYPITNNKFIHPGVSSRVLVYLLDPKIIKNRKCIDIGYGMGR